MSSEENLRNDRIQMLKDFASDCFEAEKYFMAEEILDFIGEIKYYQEKGDMEMVDYKTNDAIEWCLQNGILDLYNEFRKD